MKFEISNKECIEAIKSNYPDSRYTILRKALDKCIYILEKEIEKEEQNESY